MLSEDVFEYSAELMTPSKSKEPEELNRQRARDDPTLAVGSENEGNTDHTDLDGPAKFWTPSGQILRSLAPLKIVDKAEHNRLDFCRPVPGSAEWLGRRGGISGQCGKVWVETVDSAGLVDVGSARGSDVKVMDGDGANDGPITRTTLVGGAEIDEEGFETVGAGKRNKKDQQERANILVTTAEKQISDPAQYTDAHLRQDTKAFYVSLSDEEKARHLVVSAYHPKDGEKVFFSTTVTGSSNGVNPECEQTPKTSMLLPAKSQEVRDRGYGARYLPINGDGGRFAAFGKVHDDTRPAQFVRACEKCQEFQQIIGATDCYVGPDGGITRRSSTACPIPKKPVTEDAETKSRGLSAPKNAIEKSPTDKAGKVPRTRDTAKPGSKQERGGPPKKSTERSKTLGRDKRGKSKATKAKAKKAGGRAPQSRKSRSKAAAFKARRKNGKATSKAGGKSGKVRQRKFETTQPSPKNGKGAVKRTPKMQGKSARPKGGKAAQKKPKAAATAKAKAAKAAPAVKRATGGGKARRFRLGDRR
ncbi:hypothetical protein DFJ73DRAFT_947350 [Zopfochytrium polystomum]|nr:hypothetical protein DFJ73DRAFT_947350 [Zopfochytrium polystomum]